MSDAFINISKQNKFQCSIIFYHEGHIHFCHNSETKVASQMRHLSRPLTSLSLFKASPTAEHRTKKNSHDSFVLLTIRKNTNANANFPTSGDQQAEVAVVRPCLKKNRYRLLRPCSKRVLEQRLRLGNHSVGRLSSSWSNFHSNNLMESVKTNTWLSSVLWKRPMSSSRLE